jgi:hypothetical protein
VKNTLAPCLIFAEPFAKEAPPDLSGGAVVKGGKAESKVELETAFNR